MWDSKAAAAAWLSINECSLIESSNCGPRLGMLLWPYIHRHFLGPLCDTELERERGGGKGHPTRNIGTTRWAPTGAALPSAAVIQPPACQSSHAAHLRNSTHHGPLHTKPRNKHREPAWNFLLTGALFLFCSPFWTFVFAPCSHQLNPWCHCGIRAESFWQRRASPLFPQRRRPLIQTGLEAQLVGKSQRVWRTSQWCCSFLPHSSFLVCPTCI